jgi:hypothetical protein
MDDRLIAVDIDHPIFAYSHAIEEPCRQRFGSKIAESPALFEELRCVVPNRDRR